MGTLLSTFDCNRCGGHLQAHYQTKPENISCQAISAKPGNKCWLKETDKLGNYCFEWLNNIQSKRPSSLAGQPREYYFECVRLIYAAFKVSKKSVFALFDSYSAEARWLLLTTCPVRLHAILQQIIATNGGLSVRQPLSKPNLPESIHPGLLPALKSFASRAENRYYRLVALGHERDSRYVIARMNNPIALAVFMSQTGKTNWKQATSKVLTSFFKEHPRRRPNKLNAFLVFVDAPITIEDGRGRPKKGKIRNTQNLTSLKVLPRNQIEQELAEAKQTLSTEYYLVFWLVAVCGQDTNKIKQLTLDRITTNNEGQLLIRLHQAWLPVPNYEAELFNKLIAQVSVRWPRAPEQADENILVFSTLLDKCKFETLFSSQTYTYRRSAIYYQMLDGKLDRVTLHAAFGVSYPTIAKLECLLSADIHFTSSEKSVEARRLKMYG